MLGRPQPQMYPPVALNQYTLVNRTHKHFIYICFKAPQTSKNHTKAQQYAKYGSILMNIFLNFCFHFGGVLGKRILNPEVLKCQEDLITLDTYAQQGKTMDNKFYIYVKTYLHLWLYGGRGGGFNNQTGPILVHIYPLFNNNFELK